MKLKLIIGILAIFILTGCGEIDKNTSDFIDQCEAKPGCDYKVMTDTCVCDKTHDYIPNQ